MTTSCAQCCGRKKATSPASIPRVKVTMKYLHEGIILPPGADGQYFEPGVSLAGMGQKAAEQTK
jgi:hypothetical protein